MITALSAQPGHASTAEVHSNLVPPANSQSTRMQTPTPDARLHDARRRAVFLQYNQGVWSIRECYVPKIRDTSLVEVRHKWALAREDILHQHTDVRGPRVRCVLQDQHSISGYDGVLQNFDITQAGRT